MQDQWSSYYQGQAPPQASTSFDYTQVPQQQQQQQQLQQPQHPRQSLQPIMTTIPEQQMQLDQSTYLMPPLYTGDSSLSLSMRSGTSSSISSSVSSASGHVSPTSMRTSMSSSTTGRTPSTPASSISLASPFFTKDGQTLPTQESWFGSLQDSYLSSHPPVYDAQQAARPTLYRMDRMSISSPIPSASEQPTWGQTSMSPQQRTPRRASVAVFQSSPSNQTPSYSAQQITYNPQANYQSPPQQQMSYVPQQLQTWQQPISSVPYQQSTYAYQQPIPITGTSSDAVQSTYSMPANTGMGINLSQSYYPSQTSWQQASTSSQPVVPAENYNFAGVLLEAGDLHMLGPDPLSPTVPAATQPVYKPAKAGWQPTFSFGTETTPKPVQQATMQPLARQHGSISEMQPSWNFASFHGFTPLTSAVGTSQPLTERASSAPPPVEIAAVPMPSNLIGEDMNRRRGSSVDSPSMLPFQLATFPPNSPPRNSRASYQSSPVYLGRGPAKLGQSTIAARRATIGPSPLDLAKAVQTQSSPASHPASMPFSAPPKSGPIPSSVPASPTPTRKRGSRRSMAPMFINFTTKDAKKLLSGVAPSGSSKRKREEEEAKNQTKHVKFEAGSKESSVDTS